MQERVEAHKHKSFWKKKNTSLLTVLLVSVVILVLWNQTFNNVPTPYQDKYVKETGKDLAFTYCGKSYMSTSVLMDGVDVIKRYATLTDGKYFNCTAWNDGQRLPGEETIVPTILPIQTGVYRVILSREISENVSKPFDVFVVNVGTNELLTNDKEFIGQLILPITTFDDCIVTDGSTGTYTDKEQVCVASDGRIFPDVTSDWYKLREFATISVTPRTTYQSPFVVNVMKRIQSSVQVTLVTKGDERVLGTTIVTATTTVPVTLATATTTYPFGNTVEAYVLVKLLDDTKKEFRIPVTVKLGGATE